MSIYLQQTILAAIVVYIVDVSGFTQSWRDALARWLHIQHLRPLPPFDCGKCATFWAALILAAAQHQLDLTTAATAAALSLLSLPICQLLLFIREALCALIDLITPQR